MSLGTLPFWATGRISAGILILALSVSAGTPHFSTDDSASTDQELEDENLGFKKLQKELPATPTSADKKSFEEKAAKFDNRIEARLQEKPKSPQVSHSAARYYMERGNASRAETLTENALALARPDGNPKLTSRLLVTRGLLRYARHDYPGAHEDGALALTGDPDNWAAFELYMYSLEKWPTGKKPPSLALARHAGLEGPGFKEEAGDNLRPGSGALPREGGPPGGSSSTPQALTKEEYAADQERVARLIALQTPGIPRSPEEWVARQTAAPSPAYELLTLSKNALSSGNLSSALSLAEAAVKADPADPMVYAQRALILNQMGDSSGAVLDLSKVIAKGWKWSLSFRLRADALFKAGKWKAALADAELAARLDPTDADAYFIRAMARSKLGGDQEMILADLERAASLKPALAPFRDKAREKFGKGRGPGR